MRMVHKGFLVVAVVASAFAAGCASTGTGSGDGRNLDILTREEILGAEATNLYDVIRRLRPRWLQVRSTRSLNMETEIAVLQNDMYLGAVDQLREMVPELAYEIRYLEGARAATAIPGLLYQNSGWEQFSYRFALDYFPYLIALLALGGRPITRRVQAVVMVAILINLFGALTFGRFPEIYY